MVDTHLVILVHGVWGNSSHVSYLEKTINEEIKPTNGEKLFVYKTGSHSGYLTYDGIDVNGKRITDEILEQTSILNSQGDKVTKFSIIGYSLGGLISRYAIGILHSRQYFENIKPINFVTFCTPHIGVSNPQTQNFSVRLYNNIAPFFLAITGSQFFLKDKVGEFNKPLLVWMADHNSKFYQALSNFKYKSLYANVVNDKRCSWFTSSISSDDPVNSMYNKSPKNIECSYIKGYEPNLIDYSKPLHFIQRDTKQINYDERPPIVRFFWKTLNWIKVIGSLIIYTPFWALSFLISSIFQRIKLSSRLRKFNNNTDNKLNHLYEYNEDTSFLTDLSNKFEDEQDTLVEDMYNAMNYKVSHSKIFPKIKLDSNQSFIVEKLNSIKWNKYPIILRHTTATHAAAIVRHADPNFDEGKVVVGHFIDNVFKLE
ncbi:uncharacterized protein KGF55_005658 [Candida pseudojiufengensis]|uniref:uncharacterized protein n=1 Tax=Candida pseudojiufengensis TaxID=497109 RepID=UPI002224B38F|nr:uncharacterized protein KGF55_005658 [Candida pseudojiufengensis]KAI5959004.1 hypothetical protein KGF55_005658 [Candida pseudojiufengensis]